MSTRLRQCILSNDINGLQMEARKINIDQADENGMTALYFACMKHSVEIETIKMLLSLGASVDLKGDDGETPLYIAIFNRRQRVAHLLVHKGANLNEVNRVKKETALHLASRLGYTEMISWLLDMQADINVKNSKSETPLCAAVRAGQHNSVYLLLMAGADPTLSDEDGKTPLYVASELKLKHVVVLLKATKQNLKQAKAAADALLQMHSKPMLSTSHIISRATVDKQYRETVQGRLLAPPQVIDRTPMTVTGIKVPKLKIRSHNPLTGESYGPCRSLDEVEYGEIHSVSGELANLPPLQPSRTGGTAMIVGTGTKSGGREPIRVDNFMKDTVMEFINYPVCKNVS